MKRAVTTFALAAAVGLAASAASAQTLNTVKPRGMLNCGANGKLAGFGLPDAQGNWTGLDVDYCRAIAAAIFNDPTKVKFVAAVREGSFHRPAVGRSRRAGAQHHLDLVARHLARPELRRRQLL